VIPIKDRTQRTRFPLVTIILIAVNCVVFFIELAGGVDRVAGEFGSIPWFLTHPGTEAAVQEVPVVYRTAFGYREVMEEVVVLPPRPGSLAALFTSMFLHADFFHLIFNMLFLWVFADNIEERLGRVKFIVFYLVCGVGAALIHVLFKPDSLVPMIGASGAISGVMGAYVLLFPRNRVMTILPFIFFHVIELPAYIFLGVWFLIQLLSVGSSAGVAFLAHVGGFAIGFVLIRLFDRAPRAVP